MKNVGEGKG